MSPWVKAKAALAGLGLGLGLMGMALEARLLVWFAVGLLGIAFLLRFMERRAQTDTADVNHPTK